MVSSTSGTDWELRETGPTDARHGVLLLPGGACSAAFYSELAAEPALAGLRLVAATLPGHAGTPAPSDLSTQNYGRLAAHLATVKHCSTVLGFSMGATIALEMATTAGFAGPLILTGASFSSEAESTMLEVLDALARVTGPLPYAFMRSMFPAMLKQSTIPAQRQAELLAEFKRNRLSTLRKLMRAYLHDLRREPLIGDRLRALDAPVWIVHADKGDGRLTTRERQSLEDCPNVTVVTIPGQSFFLPNEHPAQLAALIVQALATVPMPLVLGPLVGAAAGDRRRVGCGGVLADPLVLPRVVVLLLVAAWPVDRRQLAGDLLAVRGGAARHLVAGDVHLPLGAGPLDPARGARVLEREPLF
jgi:pimeloyl-ACP methyl ester carboxylesterase